jgi:beta-lactamase class D
VSQLLRAWVFLWALGLSILPGNGAHARAICTVIVDAFDGSILLQQGDCGTRVTPASTFKIPLAVMGFDSGYLKDRASPVLPFRKGYPDWGGAAWRKPVNPAGWMRHSVVWYSQQIAKTLGKDTLERQAAAFGYGNADFSGDPGRDNGLERAWISSSLTISPLEQAVFVHKLVSYELPVGRRAVDGAKALVEAASVGSGWRVSGKTGSAFPRRADGSFDRGRGWGWFVGWAERNGKTVAFARLAQDEGGETGSGSAGLRARAAFLSEWPGLASRIGR